MDNKIMYKKILTTIAFIATIGLSQSPTVSTISLEVNSHEAHSIARDGAGNLYVGDTHSRIIGYDSNGGSSKMIVGNSSSWSNYGCNGATGCAEYPYVSRHFAIWI